MLFHKRRICYTTTYTFIVIIAIFVIIVIVIVDICNAVPLIVMN